MSINQRASGFSSANRAWTWEFEKSRGGGVRLAMGTHLLDLVNFLSGDTFKEVFFNLDAVHDERVPEGTNQSRTVDVCTNFSAAIDGGSYQANISTSAASHGPGMFAIEVLGSEGALYYDGLVGLTAYKAGVEIPPPLNKGVGEQYIAQPGGSIFRKSLCEMASEMAAHIHHRKNCLNEAASTTDAVNLMRVLDQGLVKRNERIKDRKLLF